MAEANTICIVDDNTTIVQHVTHVLKHAGYRVVATTDSTRAIDKIAAIGPNAILLDIMMPEVDGMEVLRRARALPEFDYVPIIMLTAKSYDYDKKLAMDLGANGFISKQADWEERLLECLQRTIADKLVVQFWGVRGTLPAPGADNIRYGGNTSCLTLDFPDGQLFIFDAGTGIKNLSNHLLKTGRAKRLEAKLFVSHPHWDHINALPFFAPLYMQGGEIEILGPSQQAVNMETIISEQMNGVYFPIKIREFAARVAFRDLGEARLQMRRVHLETILLNHPGNCLGYRVTYRNRRVCYVTDNELYPSHSEFYNPRYFERLSEFCHHADVLITDATYTDTEYQTKMHWGHSPISEVVKLAHAAQVRQLCLHHHDPDQHDDDIDAKLATCQAQLAALDSSTLVIAPSEGDTLTI